MPDASSSGNSSGNAPAGKAPPDARYLVTARKYRPALFRELAAQEHVTDTLKNAIRLDRLAHAYLFSGPRGVGKTTAARILAKAINCTTPLDEREDRAEPCRQCESCRSFEEGRSLGIFELDAASNNKVDDIRELRETVRVPPQGTKKKVYIIDEVHMLSNQAFNALLKTLEEPPPHVLFIFATTEPHKVLPTILSRCQRFDFRRIPAGRIAQHLQWICQEEGIDADEGSLMLLARKGDGALRDALSAFDQAVSLCGDVLRYDDLAQALGVVDADLYFRATEHVREGRSAGMLRLVEDVVGRGYDLQELLAGLSEHLRNLMVACTMEDASLIEATDAMRRRYAQSAKHFSEDDLLRLLMIAGEAEEAVKASAQPRLRLEMALLKMAALPRAADLQEALSKLDRLEKMARDGQLAELPDAPPTGEASAGETPAGETTTEPDPPRTESPAAGTSETSAETGAQERPEPEAAISENDAPPSEAETAEPGTESPPETTYDSSEAASKTGRVHEPSPEADEPRKPEAGPAGGGAPASEPSSAGDSSAGDSSPPEYDDLFDPPALSGKKKPGGDGASPRNSAPGDAAEGGPPAAAVAAPGGGPAAAQAPPATEPELSPVVERLRSHWDALVEHVRTDRIDVASYLCDAAPVSLDAGTLTVAVPDTFSRRFLLERESFLLNHVEKHLPDGAAPPSALHLTLKERADAAESDPEALLDPHAVMQRLREEDPVVKAIFEEFGGEMAW